MTILSAIGRANFFRGTSIGFWGYLARRYLCSRHGCDNVDVHEVEVGIPTPQGFFYRPAQHCQRCFLSEGLYQGGPYRPFPSTQPQPQQSSSHTTIIKSADVLAERLALQLISKEYLATKALLNKREELLDQIVYKCNDYMMESSAAGSMLDAEDPQQQTWLSFSSGKERAATEIEKMIEATGYRAKDRPEDE